MTRDGMSGLQRVAILGFGTMGAGIAQVCAQFGHDVVVMETGEPRLQAGRARVERFLAGGVERGKVTADEASATLRRIHETTSVADLADAEIVIEAIVEELAP